MAGDQVVAKEHIEYCIKQAGGNVMRCLSCTDADLELLV